jgi:DNA-binding NtrC family response regulator
MNKDTIWIVDDDRSIRWVLEKSFAKAGLTSESFENGDAMLSQPQSSAIFACPAEMAWKFSMKCRKPGHTFR